ncbi:MAG: SigB/SigF/SigG family RNA polymerase sigma factor [Actinobacteria bacterium]|nr:SigB/SigF/SigG family RNA polymerase sigma factor [Actinomycetota bacterium]
MDLGPNRAAPRGRRFLQPAPARARADRDLLARYHAGDRAARIEVMERFLPLARQIARRYARGNEPIDDLVQVASIGLLKAIERYDPSRGTAFSTFAVPTITGELKRHFRDTGWAVHVPRTIQDRILQINRELPRLTRRLGRSPSTQEIAEDLGHSIEEVIEAMEASRAHDTVSLETPRGDDEDSGTYAETVGEADRRYEDVELAATIQPTISAMSHRDQLILKMRFEDDLTQSEIADRCGISQMHVSRIIRRSLTRLRTAAEAA